VEVPGVDVDSTPPYESRNRYGGQNVKGAHALALSSLPIGLEVWKRMGPTVEAGYTDCDQRNIDYESAKMLTRK
jgi:hypothetical protein